MRGRTALKSKDKSPETSTRLHQLLAWKPSQQLPASREIEAHVRSLIKNGTLPPGTGIPSTKALAEAWDVFPNTVKHGLDPLVKEGLLDRRQNRGTFVLERGVKIQRLGIYENFGSVYPADRDFLVSLQVELANYLEQIDAELKIWVDCRQSPQKLPENLVLACQKREIDGLVLNHPDFRLLQNVLKLPVPVAAHTSYRITPARIMLNYADMIRDVVLQLHRRGATSIAVISNVVPDKETDQSNRQDVARFYDNFISEANHAGLETSSSWIIHPPRVTIRKEIERFGYEATHTLWKQKKRPDGLFIFPHTAARGALTALLELGVNIPRELIVVAHENTETPILTPLPIDWVTTSSRAIAEAMVQQIQTSLRGEIVKPIRLSHGQHWIDATNSQKSS